MQDLDSAVGRLDNILMTLYVFVVFIVVAVALVRGLACPLALGRSNLSIPGYATGDIGHRCRGSDTR
jgi:hypothetical protein